MASPWWAMGAPWSMFMHPELIYWSMVRSLTILNNYGYHLSKMILTNQDSLLNYFGKWRTHFDFFFWQTKDLSLLLLIKHIHTEGHSRITLGNRRDFYSSRTNVLNNGFAPIIFTYLSSTHPGCICVHWLTEMLLKSFWVAFALACIDYKNLKLSEIASPYCDEPPTCPNLHWWTWWIRDTTWCWWTVIVI